MEHGFAIEEPQILLGVITMQSRRSPTVEGKTIAVGLIVWSKPALGYDLEISRVGLDQFAERGKLRRRGARGIDEKGGKHRGDLLMR
ncbi:hypothetical protein [Hydrogenophilus thermoluteolus]|uniref:hypothetical protein n=1 Tax=Hydrogenophilus thermoluteolus TaxID=297 RepID=UPI003F6657B4